VAGTRKGHCVRSGDEAAESHPRRSTRWKLRRKMHESIVQVAAWLKSVIEGYYRSRAVLATWRFRERPCLCWRCIVRRRSPRGSLNWEQPRPVFDRWLTRPRTLLPNNEVRQTVGLLRYRPCLVALVSDRTSLMRAVVCSVCPGFGCLMYRLAIFRNSATDCRLLHGTFRWFLRFFKVGAVLRRWSA
jgi:hypothetical protein